MWMDDNFIAHILYDVNRFERNGLNFIQFFLLHQIPSKNASNPLKFQKKKNARHHKMVVTQKN